MGFTENNKGTRKRLYFQIYPLKQRRITTKNTGTKKLPATLQRPFLPLPRYPLRSGATAGTVTDS